MRKIMILAGIGVFYFSGVLMADKTGVGTERGQDRTGSPVGSVQQCGQCHSGGNFGAGVSLRLKDSLGNTVTQYNGGEDYTYEVEVTGSSPKFGFQTVALLSDNSNAGLMTAQSTNAKVITMNGRKYAEHNNPSTSGLFIMNWTAPAAGSGIVKFYASGNCVNGTNTSSGDQPVTSPALVINESTVSGVFENKEGSLVAVFPNPVTSVLNITFPLNKKVNVSIVDASGRRIKNIDNLENYFTFDFSGYEHGIYFIAISGEINETKKIIY